MLNFTCVKFHIYIITKKKKKKKKKKKRLKYSDQTLMNKILSFFFLFVKIKTVNSKIPQRRF